MHPLTALSPLDGRYASATAPLTDYFSELALQRYRLMVEVEYFIALATEPRITEIKPFSPPTVARLRALYTKFSLADGEEIKKIESTTNHDVKAIEYFFKDKIKKLPCAPDAEFIHFALTSEDVNNLAYSLMWQNAIKNVYLPKISAVQKQIASLAKTYGATPLLALTHGQSATPTTLGKELAVFATRLQRQMSQLTKHQLLGKLSGATGTWAAHVLAYPTVDWRGFSKKFITGLGLTPNLVTTQIEPHDSLAESYHLMERINTILLDFTRDVWLYVMRGIFAQKPKSGEIGSSTMPHKINPIYFENAEGNVGLANALFAHLAAKLPVSRLQRDLSDSTVLRNQGLPLGYSLLACENILTGLSRLTVNTSLAAAELTQHWEVLAEAVQIILRKTGHAGAYEKLKTLTRGQAITKEILNSFIAGLDIPAAEKAKLLRLTPHTYTGLAQRLTTQ